MFRPMPQDVLSRIGRFILACILFGIVLVAVFSDRTEIGQLGILIGIAGWLALLIWSAVDCFWGDKIRKRASRTIAVPCQQQPVYRPDDGSIDVDASAPTAAEMPVTRLRRL